MSQPSKKKVELHFVDLDTSNYAFLKIKVERSSSSYFDANLSMTLPFVFVRKFL